jgi:hypothetical protein
MRVTRCAIRRPIVHRNGRSLPQKAADAYRLRGQLEPAAELYRAAEVLQEVHFQVPRKGVKLVQKHVDFISVMPVVLAVPRLCAKFEGVDFGFSSGR